MRAPLDHLRGLSFVAHGDPNPVAEAAAAALLADGAEPHGRDGPPDLLLLSLPLLPDEAAGLEPLALHAARVGEAMAALGRGRIVVLLSALAVIPMRRHPAYSMRMAAMLAGVRTLAMRLGPHVLVNAVGAGLIGDPPVSGDHAMLGHAALGRAGTAAEVADAVRFLCDPRNTYTTGQVLVVDGGWSAGYGRNF